MTSSILNDVKAMVGVESDYTAFDVDIITHINTAFATLYQLGAGPENGFYISDAEDKWSDFTQGDAFLNMVKTYVQGKVRLIFDPPPTSFAIESLNKQLSEIEWRLNVHSGKEEE